MDGRDVVERRPINHLVGGWVVGRLLLRENRGPRRPLRARQGESTRPCPERANGASGASTHTRRCGPLAGERAWSPVVPEPARKRAAPQPGASLPRPEPRPCCRSCRLPHTAPPCVPGFHGLQSVRPSLPPVLRLKKKPARHPKPNPPTQRPLASRRQPSLVGHSAPGARQQGTGGVGQPTRLSTTGSCFQGDRRHENNPAPALGIRGSYGITDLGP